jgi:hypothetical protein
MSKVWNLHSPRTESFDTADPIKILYPGGSMKKAAVLVALLSFSSFGFHNLVVTPDSARIGIDTLTMAGSYEHIGDTLSIVSFFQDINNNGLYDAGTDIDELQGSSIRIIDGIKGADGKSPDDTVADGLLNLKITTGDGPFSSPGKFYFILASGGKSDTAGFKLLQIKTNTFISGTVTGPGSVGVKSLFIDVQFNDSINKSSSKSLTAVTDSTGFYVMYVDSSYRGKHVAIQIQQDNAGPSIQPTWIMPSRLDTLLTDSLKNINFAFTAASHFIKGIVQDEHANALKNAPLYLQKDSSFSPINFNTDSLGRFLIGVLPAHYGIYLQTWNFPGYLTSNFPDKNSITVSTTADTVKFTYVVHTTDTVLSGTLKDDSLVLNNNSLSVQASGYIKDTMYATSIDVRFAGAFKIKVSSEIDTYTVRFYANNLPNKFFVYPSGYRVHFGMDSCKVSILKGAARISGVVQDSQSNPANNSQVLIADTALKVYFMLSSDGNGKFSQTVPAGSYMIAFSGNTSATSRQIDGMVGPVVITASSNDTFVTCTGKPVVLAAQAPLSGRAPRSFSFSASHLSGSPVFSFATPLSGKARITLFDVRGRMIGTVLDRFVSPGSYRMRWDVQSRLLIAGQPYVVKFDFFGPQKFTKVTKLILLK